MATDFFGALTKGSGFVDTYLLPICAVIFDMDGLMLDTEPVYKIAWQRAAIECGFPISEQLYVDLIGRSRVDGENILRNAFGPDFPVDAFRAACHKCEAAAFAEQLPAKKPGLDELLAFLDSRGISKAVATSTERAQAAAQLGGLGLWERFHAIATGDEVVNGKPSPDLFLLAARRLGIEPSQCLVLEDSEAGITAAHRAGMQVWVVPDLKSPSPAVEALTQGRFRSLAAVEEQLRRLFTES
jgi:HAD superfamily hydrolase (TIGR01509 family)